MIAQYDRRVMTMVEKSLAHILSHAFLETQPTQATRNEYTSLCEVQHQLGFTSP